MSAVPLHRSATKDKLEESKTEGYSESLDFDPKNNKRGDMEYDVELRKQALMSIVNHIKNPQRRNSVFSDSDRSIGDCTFFEEEKQKYQSVQRREYNRPIRRAFSFTELKPIDEEEEFLLSEEEVSHGESSHMKAENQSPRLQRRMSFPMLVEELKDVENPIFTEAVNEYRNKLLQDYQDNVYADSKPPKPVVIDIPPVMCDMNTQTVLRDLIFEENSDEENKGFEYEEAELESNFAGELINGVIDNLSESSDFREPKKLDVDRLREIPEFELEDILGVFDVDENGNFVIKNNQGVEVDNNNHRVNHKGYLIDKTGNIINKKGEIIFYQNEVGSDGEIPAPFVYEKHKTDFLSKAMKRKEGLSIDPNYMLEDDEDLVEAELQKIRPISKESSVESLIADNPGMYVDENLIKGKIPTNANSNMLDSEIVANQNKIMEGSPGRNDITNKDKKLAKAYGGIPKGSIASNYKGQSKRITKDKTKELFPSLIVEDQAKNKLAKITDNLSKNEMLSDSSRSKLERNEELKRRLDRLKQQHFNNLNLDEFGELNMDLIDEKIDEFDQNRQLEYERRMQANIANNVFPYNKPPIQTSSNFYPQRFPFQSSELLPSNIDTRMTSTKNYPNSRLDSRPKTKQISGLRKIYGNLGEIVVPADRRDHEKMSRLQSPGSTITLRSGFSRQPTQSKFESNSRIRGLEKIYRQKLESKNKGKKNYNGKRKAKFRTLLNRYVDDPTALMDDEMSVVENNQNRSNLADNSKVSRFEASQMEQIS